MGLSCVWGTGAARDRRIGVDGGDTCCRFPIWMDRVGYLRSRLASFVSARHPQACTLEAGLNRRHTSGREAVSSRWARGVEGQRKADLGDGTFLNPIFPGDRGDPTILKGGVDSYMTFSSFNSYPGIVLWHSRDLVNWRPIGPALHKNIGTVRALDLCRYRDINYVHIPAIPPGRPWSVFVIWADRIEGPWSDPVDLGIEGCIDPGHAVGEDGKRYLFVNASARSASPTAAWRPTERWSRPTIRGAIRAIG